MANVLTSFTQEPNKILYLFPHEMYGLSLALWDSLSEEAAQAAAPNLGRYTVTLDDTYRYWYIFEGSAQPTDWNMWVDIKDIYDGKLTADDITTSAHAKINQNRR